MSHAFSDRASLIWHGVALLWLAAYLAWSQTFDLPNADPPVSRLWIWQHVPSLLLEALDPSPPPPSERAAWELWKASGWHNVPQRFPLWASAGLILWGAWGAGWLLIRALCPTRFTDPLERLPLSVVSGLSLLALGTLLAGLVSVPSRAAAVASLAGVGGWATVRAWRDRRRQPAIPATAPLAWPPWWGVLLALPCLGLMLLGASLPEVDFDVKEYHFQGPKEWYLAGRIEFLPHNVYTSFPFLTEMLVLLGMAVHGDWYWGAVVGKCVQMAYGPLTAWGIYAAGTRWFGPRAGLWGALVHLSTPWIFRISTIALAEGGLTAYLFGALWTMLRALRAETPAGPDRGELGLAGFLAGSAMACKYPGLVSVVLPLGVVLGVNQWYAIVPLRNAPGAWRTRLGLLLAWGLGVSVAMGPWLAKNAYQTGNPVYPLAWSVFGGRDWDARLNEKWKAGHSPPHYRLDDALNNLVDVAARSDWLSPLLFGLAPLALFRRGERRLVRGLVLYVAYLWGTWWLLTHRIDRFWVPLIPIVSLLAGAGASWSDRRMWRYGLAGVGLVVGAGNVAFMTSGGCGYNRFLLDLDTAARHTAEITSPELVWLAAQLPPGARVLSVGEAEVFDARFPVIYHTVFDRTLLVEWCTAPRPDLPEEARPWRLPDDIRREFARRGITHILVNWQEILRYRLTYGYSRFVTPERFRQLQAWQVLGPAWSTPGEQAWDRLRPDQQQELAQWAPELIVETPKGRMFTTFAVYPVMP